MTSGCLTIADVNEMTTERFVEAFAGIAEHSPWVAAAAAESRPYVHLSDMIAAFADAIKQAGRTRQLELLNAHPDLAGRAAVAGDIGIDSRSEQTAAGLDQLTPDEFERFSKLNAGYRENNGFPFILAVRGATKQDILEAFETRISNDAETELETAVEQVCRIVSFRLQDRMDRA